MANVEELQKQHEARLSALVAEMIGRGDESDLALVRALVHRGVHLAAERKSFEFCALAMFLAEMITHAHQIMHGGDKSAPAHRDVAHN